MYSVHLLYIWSECVCFDMKVEWLPVSSHSYNTSPEPLELQLYIYSINHLLLCLCTSINGKMRMKFHLIIVDAHTRAKSPPSMNFNAMNHCFIICIRRSSCIQIIPCSSMVCMMSKVHKCDRDAIYLSVMIVVGVPAINSYVII